MGKPQLGGQIRSGHRRIHRGNFHCRLQPGAEFFAIERDPHFASVTRECCPDVRIVEECVSQEVRLCHEAGIDSVDAILCGLTSAAFSLELQNELLDAMFEVLPPGGKFATFAYWQGLVLTAGQRFRRYLHEHFFVVT